MTSTLEIPTPTDPIQQVSEQLQRHWAMDEMAAATLSTTLTDNDRGQVEAAVADIENDTAALQARDTYRTEIVDILQGRSQKKLLILGPCSLDAETDYSDFFDKVEQLQIEHPDVLIAVRLNGKKPRTKGGWTGPLDSTNPAERAKVYDTYKEAYHRKIAILTEITDQKQLGSLAPYLSGFWLGARDMQSTELRAAAALIHLPVLVKNSHDGLPETVDNAITAIGMNTAENDGSGVDLGVFAATDTQRGFPTGVLPVGEGNHNVGIIARGYKLEEGLSAEERRQQVVKHLSELCVLAARRGSMVLIDGSHDVPPMLDIKKADNARFPRVLRIIMGAMASGEIERADRLAGFIGEMGPTAGRTDPNLVATEGNVQIVSTLVADFKNSPPEKLPKYQGQ